MMKKPMLNAIQKVKMAMEKKPKMAMKKKPKMAMPKKPKFNPKLKQAAKSGKLDNNPKFKAAVMKGSKKPKMAMMKKPMKVNKIGKKTLKADKKLTQAQQALEADKVNKAMRKFRAGTRKAVKADVISKEDRKKLIKDARSNKPKMAMKKKPMMAMKKKK